MTMSRPTADRAPAVGSPPPDARRAAARDAASELAAVDRACTPSAIAVGLFFVLPFVFVFLTSVMSDQQALTSDAVAADLALAQLRGRLADARASSPGGATRCRTPCPAPC